MLYCTAPLFKPEVISVPMVAGMPAPPGQYGGPPPGYQQMRPASFPPGMPLPPGMQQRPPGMPQPPR